MRSFRRYYIPGAIIFITCVTKDRRPYLKNPDHAQIFWQTAREVQRIHPFHLLVYCVLPDHFHWIMQMPENSPNFSIPMGSFKRNFTRNLKKHLNESQELHIWQPRFWDHIIRDEEDLERHIDYIHWNPVKHGFTNDPAKWEESTFQHWVNRGYYPENWGKAGLPGILNGLELE